MLSALLLVSLFAGGAFPGFTSDAVATLQSPQAEGPWPMFRHDAQNTGRSSGTGPSLPTVYAQTRFEGRVYASPSVDGQGHLFAATNDSMFALSDDGSRLWSAPSPGLGVSSPLLTGDLVVAGATDGSVYARLSANGSTVWTVTTEDEVWASPKQGPDGTIYIGSRDRTFYAINPATGTVRWRFVTDGEIVSSAAIASDGTVYVASADDRLYALTPAGAERWRFTGAGGDLVASPAVARNGTIYIGSRDGRFYAVSSTGSLLWSRAVGNEVISSAALAANGSSFVASRDGHLAGFSAAGDPLWPALQLDGTTFGSPALDAAGTLYIGTLAGNLYAVNTTTGRIAWTYRAEAAVWGSTSIGDNGQLYVPVLDTVANAGQMLVLSSLPFYVEFTSAPVAGRSSLLRVRALQFPLPSSGSLFIRNAGARFFSDVLTLLPTSPGVFEATIPADLVNERGIEYYVAFDVGEGSLTVPLLNPGVKPAFQSVEASSLTMPLAMQARGYRMISVPFVLDDSDPGDVLDEYGPYLPDRWRLFRWDGDAYAEFPAISASMTPGSAFFLITRSGAPFDVGAGHSVSAEAPYPVVLPPGMSQIAVPFAFPVRWSDVIQGAADVQLVATFDVETGEMVQSEQALDVLQPWDGYFVLNRSSRPTTIYFPPLEAQQGSGEDQLRAAGAPSPLLRLEARLTGTRLQDTQNWVGLRAEAEAGDDPFDLMEAPPIGEFVRLW